MKSPETTWAILGVVLFSLFMLMLGSMAQNQHECRKLAMQQKYPAIEIQGICE
jgi:hypothetical protein